MITINLSPSQYRVVRSGSAGECSSAVTDTARASRMSQATAPTAKATPTVPPATTTTATTRLIYGIVNLALLAVSIYLLWANL